MGGPILLDPRKPAEAQTMLGFLITTENTVWVGDPVSPFCVGAFPDSDDAGREKPSVSCRVGSEGSVMILCPCG